MRSPEEYEAEGLFDPTTDTGTGRLELLDWLDGQGFGLDEMVVALANDGLGALAGDRRMVPGPRLTDAESIARSGLSVEQFSSIAMAFGFVPPEHQRSGDLALTETEVDAMAVFSVLSSMFSDDEGLGFLRVVGTSMARIAEAGVAMFLTDVESPHLASQSSELVLAKNVYDAVSLLDEFMPLLDPLLRRHMLQSVERSRLAMIDETERLRYRYAVGFVDLVGFTPISANMSARELGTFIREFEARAHDAVTEAGARLVKLIGDEVMFVAPSADAACKVAQRLMSSFATETSDDVEPRGGLAYGEVLVRGGDYYGEIVNLASRLAGDAQPAELLVTEAFAVAAECLDFEPAGRRALKGFTELVEVRSYDFDKRTAI